MSAVTVQYVCIYYMFRPHSLLCAEGVLYWEIIRNILLGQMQRPHIKALKKTCLTMRMSGPEDGQDLLISVQEEIKLPSFIAPALSNLPCLSESVFLPLSLSHFS